MTRDIVEEKTIDKVLEEFKTWFDKKTKQKKSQAYASRKECLGSITEEIREVETEIHSRNDRLCRGELFDLATAAIWGVCSMETK